MIEENKCDFASKIQEWLDNPDNEILAEEVRSHLSCCKVCSADLGSLQVVRELLKQKFVKELVTASSESVNRVMAAVTACSRSASKPLSAKDGFYDRHIMAWWPQLSLAFALLVCVVLFQLFSASENVAPVKKMPALADNIYSLILSKHNSPFKVESPDQMPVEEQPLALNTSYRLTPSAVILVTTPGIKLTFSDSAEFMLHENQVALQKGVLDANLREYEPGFYVKIPAAQIYPTGTRFKIHVKTDHTQLELLDGKLRIRSLSGQTVEMNEPGKLVILAGGSIDTALPASAPASAFPRIPDNSVVSPSIHDKLDDSNAGSAPKNLLDSF